MTCSLCTEPHTAYGLCNKHYQRARRRGETPGTPVLDFDPYALDRLPSQVVQPLSDWADRAACRDADPDVFFADGKGDAVYATQAKRICSTCDVVASCLEYAISNGFSDGVYGGMAPRERRVYAQKRGAA